MNLQRNSINQSLENIREEESTDLIDMQAFSKDNHGIKYLLTVIDIFSKFVWIVSLKRKTGQEVANAFSRILKEQRPSKMWVDHDREFYNKDVQKLVELYSTENEEKSDVIERVNKTIKEKMFKYISANYTRKCIDILDVLVDQYNNTTQSSIKMTAKEASRKETKIKCGEIYIQNLAVRTWLQNFRLAIMLE